MAVRQMLLASAALSACFPVAAYAQDATAKQGQPTSEAATTVGDPAESGVGNIVVTANRRAQNLQDVPISITAFEGEKLADLGIQSTNDLPQITPGLSQTRTLVGVNAFLRGVGTTSAGYSTEVPVATYLDGLYLPNSAASAFSFNNIERIEILKGPQGTLYGRNTTGGLIHVITRDPGSSPALDMSASYGNYDTVQGNFYGSTPLGDTLAANVAAVYIKQGDGWGRNLFLGTEVGKLKDFGIQGKLQWSPGADTTVTLRGFYDKATTDQGVAGQIYPGSVGADGTTFPGKYNTRSRIASNADQRQSIVSLKIEHRYDFATLTMISGYLANRSNALSPQSAALGNLIPGQGAINLQGDQRAHTFSQEVQLASNSTGSPFSWITGVFFYRDNTRISTNVYGTCIGAICVPPVPTHTDGFQYTRSVSGYADGTYDVTPTTHLTLGVRYTSDNKRVAGTVRPLAGFPNSIPAFPASTVVRPGQPFAGFPNGIDTDVTFGKLTYRAIIAQELSDDVNLFASYNRGFKSGGFNPISFTNPVSRPEVLDAFEVGVKSRTANRVFQFNASAFYYNYKDIQLRTTAPPAPPGGTLLFNAAKARIKGIDADLVIAPVPGLVLTGAIELLDAEYTRFPGGICSTPRVIGGPIVGGYATVACDLSGRRLPSAPTLSYSLGVSYTTETSIGTFEFNASDGFKRHYFWEPNNRLRQPSFHVVNAAVTWTPPGSRFSLQAFGRNLADEYYFAGAADGAGGTDTGVPAAPLTYGAKLRYKF